jgi:hypothetical protein
MKTLQEKELINIFNEILKINLYYQVVLNNFNDIKGTYKSLIKFIKSKIEWSSIILII